MLSPSHTLTRAETSWATNLQAIASSATFSAGNHKLVSDDPAASDIQNFTALSCTTVVLRDNFEAPGGGRPYGSPPGNSPARFTTHLQTFCSPTIISRQQTIQFVLQNRTLPVL